MAKCGRVFISNYVSLETTLLLCSKLGPGLSRVYLNFVEKSGVSEIFVDDEVSREAKKPFHADAGLSLTDSVSIVLARAFGIKYLGMFDQRSFRKYATDVMGHQKRPFGLVALVAISISALLVLKGKRSAP
jgi:predicted nucleic acid-binding protein